MHSSLQISGGFFSFGYTAEYRFECKLNNFQLSEVTDYLLRQFAPSKLMGDEVLTDLKGRDAGRTVSGDTFSDNPPGRDELLLVSGDIFLGAHDALHSGKGEITEKFDVIITTPFKDFEGSQHIRHLVKTARSGALPERVLLRDLGRVVPLRINTLRFGIDLFKPRYFTSLLGFSPVVTQSLLIDAGAHSFSLLIYADSLRSHRTLPLAKDGYFDRLERMLNTLFGFNLRDDYEGKLQGQ